MTSLSPNCFERAQSCIHVSSVIERSKPIFDATLSEEFVSEYTFSKYCSFDPRGDIINPKLGQTGSKFVFHIPEVIKNDESR